MTYGDGEGNAGDSDERNTPAVRKSDDSSSNDGEAVLDDDTGRHAEETGDLLRPIADNGGEVSRRVLVSVEEGDLWVWRDGEGEGQRVRGPKSERVSERGNETASGDSRPGEESS